MRMANTLSCITLTDSQDLGRAGAGLIAAVLLMNLSLFVLSSCGSARCAIKAPLPVIRAQTQGITCANDCNSLGAGVCNKTLNEG